MARTRLLERRSPAVGAAGEHIRSIPPPTAAGRELRGIAVPWNAWTIVRAEGLLERFSPGSFNRSIGRDLPRVRLLYEHGADARVGNRPLGRFSRIAEGPSGLEYAATLLDVDYVRQLEPALEAGQLGASVRFRLVREHIERLPRASELNPDRLPEWTVLEAELVEISLGAMPVYAGATAELAA